MTALISELNITTLFYLHLAWPNYGLDVLNITMHTEKDNAYKDEVLKQDNSITR